MHQQALCTFLEAISFDWKKYRQDFASALCTFWKQYCLIKGNTVRTLHQRFVPFWKQDCQDFASALCVCTLAWQWVRLASALWAYTHIHTCLKVTPAYTHLRAYTHCERIHTLSIYTLWAYTHSERIHTVSVYTPAWRWYGLGLCSWGPLHEGVGPLPLHAHHKQLSDPQGLLHASMSTSVCVSVIIIACACALRVCARNWMCALAMTLAHTCSACETYKMTRLCIAGMQASYKGQHARRQGAAASLGDVYNEV